MKAIFNKKDIIFAAGIMLAALLIFVCMQLGNQKEGASIRITIDGSEYGVYSLNDDKIIDLDGEFGHKQIVIQNGEAYMKEADCPDHYCMEYKAISRKNETIICLPHKIIVEVIADSTDESEAQLDIIAH